MEAVGSDGVGLMNVLRNRGIQLSTLTVLIAGIGINALRLKFWVRDSDIWWHLKVGDWIVYHLALPHTGFTHCRGSLVGGYSWGYEVLLALAFRWFGLLGVGLFGVMLTLLVACAILVLVRRLAGNVWIACGLGFVTCVSMLFTMMPRPHFFSIALFTVVPREERAYIAPIVPLYLLYALTHLLPMTVGFGNFIALQLWGRRLYRDHYEPGSPAPGTWARKPVY